MGVRALVAVIGSSVVALVGAGFGVAATGTVTVTVDMPPKAPLPAAVLAYPLAADQSPVGDSTRTGKATLRLEAGLWVVATSAPTGRGAPRVSATLVTVEPGRRTPLVSSGSGFAGPTIAIGTIDVPSLAPRFRAEAGAIMTGELAGALSRLNDPCLPLLSTARTASDPLWNKIRNVLRRAAQSGPPEQRGAARAALGALQQRGATSPTATLTGTFTYRARDPLRTWSATIRLTSADGTTILEKSYPRRDLDRIVEQAARDAIDAVCNERRRVDVSASIVFDTTNKDVRMTAIVDLRAVGVERIGADGKVEKGGYEFETPAQFTVRDPGITGLACPASIGEIIVTNPPLTAPVTLAVERRDGTFQVFLAPGIGATYSLADPCSPRGSIAFTAPAAPGLIIDVPGLDTVATKSGTSQVPFPGLTGTYSAEVRISRIASLR